MRMWIDLVEVCVRPPSKETVQLHKPCQCQLLAMAKAKTYLDQQEKVRVLALGRGALTLLDVMLLDVDTLA